MSAVQFSGYMSKTFFPPPLLPLLVLLALDDKERGGGRGEITPVQKKKKKMGEKEKMRSHHPSELHYLGEKHFFWGGQRRGEKALRPDMPLVLLMVHMSDMF